MEYFKNIATAIYYCFKSEKPNFLCVYDHDIKNGTYCKFRSSNPSGKKIVCHMATYKYDNNSKLDLSEIGERIKFFNITCINTIGKTITSVKDDYIRKLVFHNKSLYSIIKIKEHNDVLRASIHNLSIRFAFVIEYGDEVFCIDIDSDNMFDIFNYQFNKFNQIMMKK